MTADHKPVALVTGASGGIGAATAVELAGRGHRVVLAARRIDMIEELDAEINADGGVAFAKRMDVTKLEETRAVCSGIEKECGPIDILVNNAATIEPIGPLAEVDPGSFAAGIQTNLVGAWNVIAAVLPGMVERGGGVIVNISSGAAERVLQGWGAYSSSKAGLAMITRAVELEYGPQGIAVYGFRPGLVATPMQEKIQLSKINEISRIPLSDMLPPQAPAAAIAWLVENRPEEWRGANEPDIRDEEFRRQAGLESNQ